MEHFKFLRRKTLTFTHVLHFVSLSLLSPHLSPSSSPGRAHSSLYSQRAHARPLSHQTLAPSPINRRSSAMEPTNRRQGVRSSEDRKRVSRHGFKYSTSPPPVRSPFDSSRDAYRAALDRTQEALLTRDRLRSRRASVRRFHRAGLLPATLYDHQISRFHFLLAISLSLAYYW